MTKVYISNIVSDHIKTDGRDEITRIGLHELVCDQRIETSSETESGVIVILHPVEYESVIKNGYYTVFD